MEHYEYFLSSAWLLSLCRHGINFVNITTVDNEIVATEKQIGDEKKEIPEPIIKESFSIPSGKKEL